MSNNVKISVIMAAYNAAKTICYSIESVLGQTYRDLELIIINDGSTDNTEEICLEYQKRDPRVRVITQKNAGASAARNEGFKAAKGELITFIDSDDYYHKSILEKLEGEMKDGVDLVVCRYTNVEYHDMERIFGDLEKNNSDDLIEDVDKWEGIYRLLDGSRYSGFLWNKLFRRDLLQRVAKKRDGDENMILDESIHMCEDLLLVCQYIYEIKGVRFVNEELAFYFNNMEGISSGPFSPKLVTQLEAYSRIEDICKGQERIETLLKRNKLMFVINHYNRMLIDGKYDRSFAKRYKREVKKCKSALDNPSLNGKDKMLAKLMMNAPLGIYNLAYRVYKRK